MHCYRCNVTYSVQALIDCHLTGSEPVHFGEHLNKYTDEKPY